MDITSSRDRNWFFIIKRSSLIIETYDLMFAVDHMINNVLLVSNITINIMFDSGYAHG